jgi:hypothetical protein
MAKDLDALAAQFGGSVVQQQLEPDNGGYGSILEGLSPKDQAEMRMKIYTDASKRIDGLREVTSKGKTILNDLDRFGELNRNTATGGLLGNLFQDTPYLHSDDFNEMRAIQSRLGPSQRVQGSGASSDRDVSLFMSGLPNVGQDGNVNKAIREQYQRQYDYALKKQTFLQDYLQKYGHLNGADEQWQNSIGNEQTSAMPAATTPKIKKFNPKTGKIE